MFIVSQPQLISSLFSLPQIPNGIQILPCPWTILWWYLGWQTSFEGAIPRPCSHGTPAWAFALTLHIFLSLYSICHCWLVKSFAVSQRITIKKRIYLILKLKIILSGLLFQYWVMPPSSGNYCCWFVLHPAFCFHFLISSLIQFFWANYNFIRLSDVLKSSVCPFMTLARSSCHPIIFFRELLFHNLHLILFLFPMLSVFSIIYHFCPFATPLLTC